MEVRVSLDPERAERFQAIRDGLEKFKSGETDEVEVETPDGKTMRLIRDPDAPAGMRIEGTDGESMDLPMPMVFEPADERPDGYPEELPFLPAFRSIVTRIPEKIGGFMVQYFSEGPVDDGLERLRDLSVSDGWSEVEPIQQDDARWEEFRSKLRERGMDESLVKQATERFEAAPRVKLTKGNLTRNLSEFGPGDMTVLMLMQKRAKPE